MCGTLTSSFLGTDISTQKAQSAGQTKSHGETWQASVLRATSSAILGYHLAVLLLLLYVLLQYYTRFTLMLCVHVLQKVGG